MEGWICLRSDCGKFNPSSDQLCWKCGLRGTRQYRGDIATTTASGILEITVAKAARAQAVNDAIARSLLLPGEVVQWQGSNE